MALRHRLSGHIGVPLGDDVVKAAAKTGADPHLVAEMKSKLEGLSSEQALEALRQTQTMLDERDRRRIKLEYVTAQAFALLPRLRCPVSLITYDYGEPDDRGSVAYKTSLARPAFGHTLAELVEAWSSGEPRRVAVDADVAATLPDVQACESALDLVVAALPAGVGASLIFGEGKATNYVGKADRESVRQLFGELVESLLRIKLTDVDRAMRDWHCPAGRITTASHRELFSMNVAHALSILGLEHAAQYTELHRQELVDVASGDARAGQFLLRLTGDELLDQPGIVDFLREWRANSYARLEVGHKLAAALCLTDVPDDVTVRAPWPAWSLVVPDGLLPEEHGQTLARIWIADTLPAFGVSNTGRLWRYEANAEKSAVEAMILNLIRGACLALSNPDDFRKERQHGPTARSSSKKSRSGPPALDQARYLLSAPVKVDLREHLTGVLSGRKGASPTVQFLVRGHWRNQSHGPRHSLRRVQWIEPFWKGPEEARVLLRQHKVEDD